MDVFLIAFGTVLLVVYSCFNAHRLKQSALSIINNCRRQDPQVEPEKIEYRPWLLGLGVLYLPLLGFVLFIEYQLYHRKYDASKTDNKIELEPSYKSVVKKVEVDDFEQIALEIYVGILLFCFFIGLCGRDVKYRFTKLYYRFRY